jgi:hypothetical protein
MKGICSSETSVDSQRTTRGYIPEDGTLYFRLQPACLSQFIPQPTHSNSEDGAAYSSETSVSTYRTVQSQNLEDYNRS